MTNICLLRNAFVIENLSRRIIEEKQKNSFSLLRFHRRLNRSELVYIYIYLLTCILKLLKLNANLKQVGYYVH